MILIGQNRLISKSLVLAITIFVLSNCTQVDDASGNDAGLILQSLLNHSANPSAACKNASQQAEDCLKSTPDLAGSDETSLAGIFSGGSASNYESYCSQLLAKEELAKFNAKTQECIFTCNEAYWSRVQAEGQCEGEGTDLISRSGIETLPCVRHCKDLYTSIPEL